MCLSMSFTMTNWRQSMNVKHLSLALHVANESVLSYTAGWKIYHRLLSFLNRQKYKDKQL